MFSRVADWVDERSGIVGAARSFLYRKVPKGVNWWYTLGSATLILFIIQAITGIALAMYYAPTPDHAYESVRFITFEAPYGNIIRGIHHWAASGMVVAVVLHMCRVFFFAAYKYPRELTWITGVILLILVLGFGFTGYLLPWDEKAYWATVVGTNMPKDTPFVGTALVVLLRGGLDVGAATLTRFYAAHTLILPAAIVAVVLFHLYLVVRLGISEPPKRSQGQ